MKSQGYCSTLTIIVLSLLLLPRGAEASGFHSWLSHFRGEALAKGVSQETFDAAFSNVSPNSRVIELDRQQPELTRMRFVPYLKSVMSQKRISDGRAAFVENRALLASVRNQYGVPPEIVVALWGVETSYGQNTGGYDLIEALATLAWEGRRAGFFKKELIDALLILQGGHIPHEKFKGSWAGAMGQNQFMPSSWRRFAVDFDGDGRKDIWTTKSDVFASTSNYLTQSGWDPALKWGWEINYPQAAHFQKEIRSFQQWMQMGVRFKRDKPAIPAGSQLKMVVPDGGEGRAYLVSRNFDVIMTWNKSTYFALTVGLLSDFVAKNPATANADYQNSLYNE